MTRKFRYLTRKTVLSLLAALPVILPGSALALPVITEPYVMTNPDDGFLWDKDEIINNTIKENTPRFIDTEGDLITLGPSGDPWWNEGLFSIGFDDFEFGLWNKAHDTITGMILLIGYKGNPTSFSFQLSYGSEPESIAIGKTDFKSLKSGDPNYSPEYAAMFNRPTGPPPYNRPGDGQAALYDSMTGVTFLNLGDESALTPGDTIEVTFSDFTSSGGTEEFALHFDAYGYTLNRNKTEEEYTVWCTNPNSGDLTVAVPEASTMILFGTGLVGLLAIARRKMPFLTGH